MSVITKQINVKPKDFAFSPAILKTYVCRCNLVTSMDSLTPASVCEHKQLEMSPLKAKENCGHIARIPECRIFSSELHFPLPPLSVISRACMVKQALQGKQALLKENSAVCGKHWVLKHMS